MGKSIRQYGPGWGSYSGRNFNVLAGLALLVLSLAACEFIVRFSPVLKAEFHHVQIEERFLRVVKINPLWGWGFAPNIDVLWDSTGREREPMVYRFRTVPIPGYEEYGMRDDGWNPSARRTIAVLGDSYTFGATVAGEDIWCEQIESRNPGVDMLNIAMGSGVAKAVAEYTVLKDRLPLHDAVVYEMYLGNEFLDNDVFAEAMKHVDEEIAAHASSYRRARILSSSKLLFAAARVASRIKWAILGARNRPTEYVAEEDGYWDERFGNFLLKPKNPILLRYAEPVYTDNRITHGIEETEKNLVHLKELVGSRKFVVLLFPFKEMIHFDAIRHQMPDLDITRPSRIVLDLCRKHGITCMDLTAGLLAHRNERLNWDYDHHLNKVGQYYASLEAERALHGLGLLSGQP